MLKNAKHEAFAQAVAEGKSATRAYLDCVSEHECTTKTAMEQGSRLMADCKIAARVAELRKSFAEILEHRLGVRKETIARRLLDIIETPVGEVGEGSPLCQEYKRTRKVVGHGDEAEEWETEQIKTPSKLDAAEKLIKMAGWYEPEKVENKLEVVIRRV